jgi:hypothetical protein
MSALWPTPQRPRSLRHRRHRHGRGATCSRQPSNCPASSALPPPIFTIAATNWPKRSQARTSAPRAATRNCSTPRTSTPSSSPSPITGTSRWSSMRSPPAKMSIARSPCPTIRPTGWPWLPRKRRPIALCRLAHSAPAPSFAPRPRSFSSRAQSASSISSKPAMAATIPTARGSIPSARSVAGQS